MSLTLLTETMTIMITDPINRKFAYYEIEPRREETGDVQRWIVNGPKGEALIISRASGTSPEEAEELLRLFTESANKKLLEG